MRPKTRAPKDAPQNPTAKRRQDITKSWRLGFRLGKNCGRDDPAGCRDIEIVPLDHRADVKNAVITFQNPRVSAAGEQFGAAVIAKDPPEFFTLGGYRIQPRRRWKSVRTSHRATIETRAGGLSVACRGPFQSSNGRWDAHDF